MYSPKLKKSRTDRVLSGVCGGIAEFFGISSFAVRLIFFISVIFAKSPVAIIIYLILVFALPKDPPLFRPE
ncbi:PspC domain-containing protein [Sporolactobacillus kofuensis]|uniref:PspC domain-containing protein n=1 Tax=Sporolactobacillus kofuensis TaxID=269672 RepID=A0ABW1WFL0_9BACL|nr:PspC domain-containing protein [Sporolactobacillus kofuensis]MCO7176270.1 PspC domain-containing protein [Sporolactobacillus kofuensis]